MKAKLHSSDVHKFLDIIKNERLMDYDEADINEAIFDAAMEIAIECVQRAGFDGDSDDSVFDVQSQIANFLYHIAKV